MRATTTLLLLVFLCLSARAQVTVKLRLKALHVENVDSDDVADDDGDAGAIGDNDEFTWRVAVTPSQGRTTGRQVATVLGRDGDVAGDPFSASFAMAQLDYFSFNPSRRTDSLLLSYGGICTRRDDIRLAFDLWAWEDDGPASARSDYDRTEDDFLATGSASINLDDYPADVWTDVFGDPSIFWIRTGARRYGFQLEVKIERLVPPPLVLTPRSIPVYTPADTTRVCGGDTRYTFALPELPTPPEYSGVPLKYRIQYAVNAPLDEGRGNNVTFPAEPGTNFFNVPHHSGRDANDTIRARVVYFYNSPSFFLPDCYSSGANEVVIVVERPVLTAEDAELVYEPAACGNADSSWAVELGAGLDVEQYRYTLTDPLGNPYSSGGFSLGNRFRFDTFPSRFVGALVAPPVGQVGCPLRLRTDFEVELPTSEYTLRFASVNVQDATTPGGEGRITAEISPVAETGPYFQSYFNPFAGDVFPLGDNGTQLSVAVAPGEGYAIYFRDRNGCTLDSTGITVGGAGGSADPRIDSVRVEPGCAIGGELSTVRVYATHPTSPYFEVYIAGFTDEGVAFRQNDPTGGSTIRNVPPGRYAPGIDDVANGDDLATTDTFSVVPRQPLDTVSLVVNTQFRCPPTGFEVVPSLRFPQEVPGEYSLDGSAFAAATTYESVGAGAHLLRWRDRFGCLTGSLSFSLDTGGRRIAIEEITPSTCGQADGGVLFAGSSIDDLIEWSIDSVTWSTGRGFGDLAAGSYTGYMRIGSGSCITSVPFVIPSGGSGSSPLDPSITRQISCFGASDGEINLFPPSEPAYEFSLNGAAFQPGGVFSDLAAGTYVINSRIVGTSCGFADTLTLTEPIAISVGFEIVAAPTCGQADGRLEAFAFDGVEPYAFLWDDGQTTRAISGRAAGPVELTVTDARGCSETRRDTIRGGESPVLTAVVTATPRCVGEATGVVDLSASAPNPATVLLYTLGSTTNRTGNFTGLAAGSYTAIATDSLSGCADATTVVITAPPAIVASLSAKLDPACAGAPTGSITLSATGGTGMLTYSIDNGETYRPDPVFSQLATGTYQPLVRDANACLVELPSVTLIEPTPIALAARVEASASCGAASGEASVVVSGGTGPYRYRWSNGDTTARATDLPGGAVSIAVTDANGCTASTSQTIESTPAINVSVASIEPASCGQASGRIELSVNQSTGGVSYIWSHDATLDGPIAAELAAGIFTVTVTDEADCSITLQMTVPSANGPSVQVASQTRVGCDGSPASATVTASGGTGALTIRWSNGETGATAGNLPAGTTTATVTDANGCTTAITVNILREPGIDLAVTTQPASCSPGNDGAIIATPANPTGLRYALEGFAVAQTSGTFRGLAPGTYLLVTQRDGQCERRDTITVGGPPPGTLAPLDSIAIAMPLCAGEATGTLQAYPSPGTTLTYSLNGGTFQATPNFAGLAAGTYVLTRRSTDSGCEAKDTVVISAPTPILGEVIDQRDVACFGESRGSLTLSGSGGTMPYLYSIDGGETYQADPTFGELAAGTYAWRIQDANACTTAGGTATLMQPTLLASAASVVTPANCGSAIATLGVQVSGGTAPYRFLWSTGGTSAEESVPAPGSYEVSVTDANQCITDASIDVPPASNALEVSLVDLRAAACGQASGQIQVRTNTTGSVLYSWSHDDDLTGPIASELTGGTYTVVASAAGGCTDTLTIVVPTTSAPEVTDVRTTDAGCGSIALGSLEITASGEGLRYSIDGGRSFQDAPSFVGLAAGSYEVVVASGEACVSAPRTVIIGQAPNTVATQVAVTQNTCTGQASGIATVTASGGTGAFTYALLPDGTPTASGTFEGLAAGLYRVTVRDGAGCVQTASFTIEGLPAPGVSVAEKIDPRCGQRDGAIALASDGSAGSLSYAWSDGGTGDRRTGLAAGVYEVTASSAAGCTSSLRVVLVDQGAPSLSVAANSTDSCGRGTGSLSVTIDGGQAPYRFRLNGAAAEQPFTGLMAGTYTVEVTDDRGCVNSDTATVRGVGQLLIALSDTSVCTAEPVRLTPKVLNGTIASYLWSDGSTGASTLVPVGSSISLRAVSPEGCSAEAEATVSSAGAGALARARYTPACSGEPGGTLEVAGFGESDSLYVLGERRQATPSFRDVAPGVYTYGVLLRSGCLAVRTDTLTGLRPVVTVPVDTTFGECRPIVTVRTSGGLGAPYNYSLGGVAIGMDSVIVLSGLGAQTLIASDAGGCTSAALTFNIAAPSVPAYMVDQEVTSCAPPLASVTFRAPPGLDNVYVWEDGFVGAFRQNLPAGTYPVVITSRAGCSSLDTIVVTTPPAISIALGSVTPASDCARPNGEIRLVTSGGTGALSFSWSHDASLRGPVATGLAAGKYTATVSDGIGCSATLEIEVAGIAGVRITLGETTPVRCSGVGNGAATIVIAGATASEVDLRWNGITAPASRSDLAAGPYTVVARDLRGCSDTLRLSVGSDVLRVDELLITDGGCDSSGLARAVVVGGTGAYRYRWTDGTASPERGNLAPGRYTLAVTDAAGCRVDTSFTVGGASAVVLPARSVTICPGASREVSVGFAPSQVTWLDDSGLILAMDSVLTISQPGVYRYEVSGQGPCGTRGEVVATATADAFYAQFLLAGQAVAGAEVVALETSVPTPDLVSFSVSGPATPVDLGVDRNQTRWRFDVPGTYTVTLSASLGACEANVGKTIEIVRDSTELRQGAPVFSELLDLTVGPNPTSGPLDVNVTLSAARPISVRLYSNIGALIERRDEAAAAVHKVSFDLGPQPVGNYFIVVTTGSAAYTRAVVKG